MDDVIQSIQSENIEKLRDILIREPGRIAAIDENGIGAQYLAARKGNLTLMQYIVENTMSKLEQTDPQGRSCLHYAVESGNLAVVEYLTEKVGLSPLTGDHYRITPYHMAHNLGFQRIEDYFLLICGCRLENMYQNPVRTGMFPDPSIVRVGNDYYMVNSSFIYFPCIPVSHSTDLIHWKIIGHAITNPDFAYLEELEGGRGYWAPDISYYAGRFYITATYRMNDTGTTYRKQMVVSSERPEGPYCEPSFIEVDGIDPSIFTDEDGKRYMLLNRGARIFEISKDGTKQLSEPRLLYYGDCRRATEGPHLLKKDGWYYLFLAEGGTGRGHRISVARSRNLFGGYEPCPYNPIMTQQDSEAALQCCGHGKPVMTQNGEWYMAYLCNRYVDQKYGLLGRETALDPITWTPDGWPLVNNRKGPSVLQRKPDLPETTVNDEELDHFDTAELRKDWFFPRTREQDGIQLTGSILRIRGSRYDLNSIKARNVILQRQRHFCFDIIVKMAFPKLIGQQNTGLVCYYDENTYLKFALYIKPEDGYVLRVFEKIGEEEGISLSADIKQTKSLYLKVHMDGLLREFMYSHDDQEWKTLGVLRNVYYLCSEAIKMGKRFTGAAVGMYAFGSDNKEELLAEFDYFKYIPGDN